MLLLSVDLSVCKATWRMAALSLCENFVYSMSVFLVFALLLLLAQEAEQQADSSFEPLGSVAPVMSQPSEQQQNRVTPSKAVYNYLWCFIYMCWASCKVSENLLN